MRQSDDGGEVGGAGVHDVVVARHREVEHVLDAVVHEHRPGAEVVRAHRADPQVGPLGVAVGEHGAAGGARRVGQAPRPVVVVAGDDEPAVGDGPDEGGVGLLDRLDRAVEVEVVGLHVRDDGDVGAVGEEGAVALVGLDDEGRAVTEGGVGAELRDLATRGERRVGPGGDEGDHEHRGRRGLPVGARDRDPARAAHERGEGLGAVQHTQPRGAGGGELDVVVADRRRHHDRVDVGDVGRVVAEVDAGTAVAQRLQRGAVGRVGAADRAGHGRAGAGRRPTCRPRRWR